VESEGNAALFGVDWQPDSKIKAGSRYLGSIDRFYLFYGPSLLNNANKIRFFRNKFQLPVD
jgi:hypothetical protein